MERMKTVFIVALFVSVVATSAVWIILTISRKPIAMIIRNPQSILTGGYNVAKIDTYLVAGKTVTFTLTTDLRFPVSKLKKSSAFQRFLFGAEFDMNILRPLLRDQTPAQIPQSITILVTDKFVETNRTTYRNEDRTPLYAYAFSYDQPSDTLAIVVYISKEGWESVYTSDFDETRVSPELIIGREILFAIGQFDKRFFDQSKRFGDIVSKYLNADGGERLL